MSCAKRGGPVDGRSCRRTEERQQLAEGIVVVGADEDWVLGKRESGKDEGSSDEKDRGKDHGGGAQ